jgi:hypothetical protein
LREDYGARRSRALRWQAIGGRMGNSSHSLTVQSTDTATLYDWAHRLETAVAALPEVQDVSDDNADEEPAVISHKSQVFSRTDR